MTHPVDEALFRWANRSLGEPLDAWLGIATSSHSAPPILLCAILVAFCFGGRRWRGTLAVLGVTIAITDGGNHLIVKPAIGRERPCVALTDVTLRQEHCPRSASMPSSHALNSAAAAAVVGVRHPAWIAPAAAVAAVVSFSRLHAGVHFPSDVAVGAIAGVLLGATVAWASTRPRLRRRLGRSVHAAKRALLRGVAAVPPATRWRIAATALLGFGTLAATLAVTTTDTGLAPGEADRWNRARQALGWPGGSEPAATWWVGVWASRLGSTEAGLRLGSIPLAAVIALALFALGKRTTGRDREAFATLALVGATPMMIGTTLTAGPNGPVLLLWTLALIAAIEAARRESTIAWCVLGAAVGLGTVADGRMLLFLPLVLGGVLGTACLRPLARTPGPLAALAVATILVALVPGGLDAARFARWPGAPVSPGAAIADIVAQLFAVSPWVAFAMAAGFVRSIRRARAGDRAHAILAWTSAPALVALWATGSTERLGAWGTAPAYVGFGVSGASALVAWVTTSRGRARRSARRGALFVATGTLVTAVVLVSPTVYEATFPSAPVGLHPAERRVGWRALGAHVGRVDTAWRTEGGNPVIATDRPGLVGELAFYVPGQPGVSEITAHRAAALGPVSSGAELAVGRDALLVTGDRGLHPAIALAFERCTRAPPHVPMDLVRGPGHSQLYWVRTQAPRNGSVRSATVIGRDTGRSEG